MRYRMLPTRRRTSVERDTEHEAYAMSASAGYAALKRANKQLKTSWHTVAMSWRDDNMRHFEARYVTPLLRKVREAEEATKQMEMLLTRARRDCEDRG